MTSDMSDHGPDHGPNHGAALAAKLSDKSARVGVIGLGYVGLPLAVTAAKAGFAVTGFDVDPTKMTRLDAGTSYIEAVEDSDLAEVKDRFDWTTISRVWRAAM
jgi:UDP-N-acetyl-D-glucosamine dehydrogenase